MMPGMMRVKELMAALATKDPDAEGLSGDRDGAYYDLVEVDREVHP